MNILSVIFLIILSLGSCSRQYDDTPERKWWNSLNETWQIVFLREIDKLNKTPLDEDLAKILQLESVECDHFPIGDAGLEPLVKLKRLKSISAGSTHISNIEPLANLDSLVFVNFANTPIDSIEALSHHQNLESVYIQQTNVKDLTPLEGKKKLQVVVFSETEINSISPLMDLLSLSIVVMNGTKVPESQIGSFIENHKDCDINY